MSTEGDTSTITTGETESANEESTAEERTGYAHQPLDDERAGSDHEVVHPDAAERNFDWRGWILVGVLFLAFVVAPLTIYFVPPSASAYFTVLIVFPLFPALVLAAVAVWATTRP